MKIPNIPEDAPFSVDQKTWLSGFLAGLNSRLIASSSEPAAGGQQQGQPLDILYGTQTGNAEGVAQEAAEMAAANGFSPRVAELDAIDMDALAAMKHVLVVISTYGEGEMPDNAHIFWEAFTASTAPRLEELSFAVLGLGDTSYDEFCQAGKLMDLRFEQLGAKRLTDRVDCDVDFEDPAAEWMNTAIPLAKSDDWVPSGDAVPVQLAATTKSKWTRKNPYPSRVVENRLLSGDESGKEIRHFAFDLGDSGIEYEAGDALGVMPINHTDLVEAIIARIGADKDTKVSGHDAPLGELLMKQFEIMTPSKELIAQIAEKSGHIEFHEMHEKDDKKALDDFLWGKDTLDLLNLNPSLEISADEFVSWLKPLQHRAYSISSSPKAHKGEVHLTVAAVRWQYEDRQHRGVASTWLADCTDVGTEASIFLSANKSFRPPEDNDAPMIMVGPGTGIAPFRAFLEERRERGAKGKNWLLFGDQHRHCDYIYEDEITAMQNDGLVTQLDLAFSRDQEEKIYVQHRMLENSKMLFEWLEEGGYFYVCGDASRMAKDVDAALHEVIRKEGGFDADKAIDYVNELKKSKRYLRDVY